MPSAEWLVVQGGKIKSIFLLFDRSRWPEVLQEPQMQKAETGRPSTRNRSRQVPAFFLVLFLADFTIRIPPSKDFEG